MEIPIPKGQKKGDTFVHKGRRYQVRTRRNPRTGGYSRYAYPVSTAATPRGRKSNRAASVRSTKRNAGKGTHRKTKYELVAVPRKNMGKVKSHRRMPKAKQPGRKHNPPITAAEAEVMARVLRRHGYNVRKR